jgi:hypothetical protein
VLFVWMISSLLGTKAGHSCAIMFSMNLAYQNVTNALYVNTPSSTKMKNYS